MVELTVSHVQDEEDRISRLPDEILVSILSRLTMEEAARTSVLSGRWELLWTFFTGSLDFDASGIARDLIMRNKSPRIETPRLVSWVNKVVKSLQSSSIDEFRICFDVDRSYSSNIDTWVKFASDKRVKRLELDLTSIWNFQEYGYDFPLWTLDLSGFLSLTSLCLKYVEVTGEVLEHFLSDCPLLEQLCVEGSESLVNLKVNGPSLKLKYLEIWYCYCMENIEISAVNLVSFRYYGPVINVPMKKVPLLVDLLIGGKYSIFALHNSAQLSSSLSQIETLVLDIPRVEDMDFPEFTELGNLKNLELVVCWRFGQDLLGFTSLIRASPLLYKFTLKLWQLDKKICTTRGNSFTVARCPHQCLKVVEIIGFIGLLGDVELAQYLLENAVSLEKITINPHNLYKMGYPLPDEKIVDLEAARRRAKHLKRILPPTAELQIL